ncbi:MAG: hypothetical protein FWF68_05030 [Spirochaetes bacterium]|nr:hypothetical protein [Spirochaetota bacterium]
MKRIYTLFLTVLLLTIIAGYAAANGNTETTHSDNLLFPADGVTLGKTTVNELKKLGKRTTTIDEDTNQPYLYYVINGINVWYDEDTNLAESYYIVNTPYDRKLPVKWVSAGMSFDYSYDQWLNYASSNNLSVQVTKSPQTGTYNGHSTFIAELVLSYTAENVLYEITLNFNRSDGTKTSDKNTLYFIDVSGIPVKKIVGTQSTAAAQTVNLLFPADGVTLGKTTVNELMKLGKRSTNIDKDTNQPYLYYVINGINVWYDDKTNLASHYYITHSGKLPEKWVKAGMSLEYSYDQWLDFAKKNNLSVQVTKSPQTGTYNGHSTFIAELVLSYTAEGISYVIDLDFNYSEGTKTSDKKTLYSIYFRGRKI